MLDPDPDPAKNSRFRTLNQYLFDPLLGFLLHVCELVLQVLHPPEVALSLLLQDTDPHQVLPTLLPPNLLHTSSLVEPGSGFFPSRIQGQKGSGSASKNLSIFSPKYCF